MKLKFLVILFAAAFAASAVAVADADAKGGKNPNMATVKKLKKGEKRCEINGVGELVCRKKRR